MSEFIYVISVSSDSRRRAAVGIRSLFFYSRSVLQHALGHKSEPASMAAQSAFIKASKAIGTTHDISILKMNPGDPGSANRDLPAYVVRYSGRNEPSAGSVNWSSGFLPALYQGVVFRPGPSLILNLLGLDHFESDPWTTDPRN